ncbi:transporter substrate-binding domain-containing protein [Pollutimonas bauzanensis]|uniref:Polar amino acid transport system substrate-binding protein n=1 Tax=Pollutimonas bauzanensis TaxID=658167 RepID=A0A1M5YFV9_9BURK|nr:transporter substrate-binding domain-containing protein [Pollutimonas bauzanensis]SHI10738.1 polar amino acid transport system substrate-binding protein [Pollutimonas bauzanensis]
MNSLVPRRFSILFRACLAGALACAGASGLAARAASSLAPGGTLALGVDYVVPPFAAGSKVRTPEGIETFLADDLARRLSAPAQTLQADPASRGRLLDEGRAQLLLLPVADADPLRSSALVIPTGYSSGAMAIMRSDTNIKTWQQLAGRTVCLAQGGRYEGRIAAQYGALEKVFKAPADSLLALRTGGCDAAVHDSAMLEELLKLPEWKKFSARLPTRDLVPLAFVVASGDSASAGLLRQVAKDWASSRFLEKTTKKAVQDIAFEVYLDQTVTDCH